MIYLLLDTLQNNFSWITYTDFVVLKYTNLSDTFISSAIKLEIRYINRISPSLRALNIVVNNEHVYNIHIFHSHTVSNFKYLLSVLTLKNE